jgi:hypothetical protein
MVKGKTAAEVQNLLGRPDSRQKMLLAAERWIWWNYTYLDGNNYPPEMRGRKVHLEIIFERTDKPAENSEPSLSELRAADPLSISYAIAKEKAD